MIVALDTRPELWATRLERAHEALVSMAGTSDVKPLQLKGSTYSLTGYDLDGTPYTVTFTTEGATQVTTQRSTQAVAAELLASPDGVTVSTVEGLQVPTTGYVVGVKGLSDERVASEGYADGVIEWLERIYPHTTAPGRYVGSWRDAQTGIVYLDVVDIMTELAPALQAARERGEVAIFDLAAGEEIRTYAGSIYAPHP